jgi:hypothetical protein
MLHFSTAVHTEFPAPSSADKKGFGFTVKCADLPCRSWKWFSVQDGKKGYKSQEGGALGIDVEQVGSNWEITRTQFTTDVSLRVYQVGLDPVGSAPRWRINISKGSTIKWPSMVNGQSVPN